MLQGCEPNTEEMRPHTGQRYPDQGNQCPPNSLQPVCMLGGQGRWSSGPQGTGSKDIKVTWGEAYNIHFLSALPRPGALPGLYFVKDKALFELMPSAVLSNHEQCQTEMDL